MEKYVKKFKTTETKPAPEHHKPIEQHTMGFQFEQKKGDLFSCPNTASLAHCISEDIRMGKGIAVLFRNKFGGIEDLKSQKKKPGEVAVLKHGTRFVYYLITKEKAFHKPTYATLLKSLEATRLHCKQHGVGHLCMPRIGCGLDGLDWSKVAQMIQDVYKDEDIKVTVYTI